MSKHTRRRPARNINHGLLEQPWGSYVASRNNTASKTERLRPCRVFDDNPEFQREQFLNLNVFVPMNFNFRWDTLRFAMDQDVRVPVAGIPGATVTLDGNISGHAGLSAELQLDLGAASVNYGVTLDAPTDELFRNAPVAFDTGGFSVLGGALVTAGPDPAGGYVRLGLDWERGRR
ncbi:MAG TPA: hypothetical protein VGN83_19505 [Falsiroseomonas sp.]|nr:hypothetical protein [Falsiroseomonas sp.]